MRQQLPEIVHVAAAQIGVPSAFAFERLCDPGFIGGWALGSMDLQSVAAGVFRGRSLFDGSEAHVEIRPAPALGLIDFAVGSATERSPRIFIRVTPGAVLGLGEGRCLVSLHALRSAGADDERWMRTCTAHETEILLIKAQLERAYAGAAA